MKEIVAWAVVNAKGRVVSNGLDGLHIYKTKKVALDVSLPDSNETVEKVRIVEV